MWVNFISLIFLIPLEYSLLETDGQLRALCGFKSNIEMVSGWKHQSRFIMVKSSKFKFNGWRVAKLNGFRRMFGCLYENSKLSILPGGNYYDQLKDGCKNKV